MSTDDSISEDVSTSAALSHQHNADASGGKGSEASILSSGDTTPLGLAGPEEEEEDRDPVRSVRTLQGFLQGAVRSRSPPTPASGSPHKSSKLFLSPEEFSSGRSLPSINPSPLETLTALVQEIQKSGETDPELWKDSEGRWLHLFKLVEKQYQEQILAQQDQYQCQIQLIQDEIKALVQLQNRPSTTQPADDSPDHTPGESPLSDPAPLAPSPSATRLANPHEPHGEGAGLACSGYRMLTTSEPEGGGEDKRRPPLPSPPACSATSPPLAKAKGPESPRGAFSVTPPDSLLSLQSPSSDQSQASRQLLTTWAQRHKRRQQSRPAQDPQLEEDEREEALEEAPEEEREERSCGGSPHPDHPDNYRSMAQSSFYLKRSDSLVSQASGLTYWRLDESELFCPLPNSLDSGAYHLIQEASAGLSSPDETRLSVSLREIYQSKQREETRQHDWSSPFSSNTSIPQVTTLHTAAHVRQPRQASSFTSPFRFSSPSFPTQSQPCPPGGAPITPDSVAEGIGRWHADTLKDGSLGTPLDRTFLQSSNSVASPSPATSPPGGNGDWRGRPHGREEASHGKLQAPHRAEHWPPAQSRAGLETISCPEDPVIQSVARQNMREKTSRHIADLRAYYESEIGDLKEKLGLANQPPGCDLKETNQILQDRCENLERSLRETRTRAQELEEQNLLLKRQLTEWQERYDTDSATVTALQQRLEEANQSGREKDAATDRLRARVQQLEEAYHDAYRVSDDREARRKKEHKMLQDLLVEYEALGKDHERVKDKLVLTEDRLFEANAQISDLKRIVSKLESQIKQLEHENLKIRHIARSHSQPSGAGLYHHPELLLSPSKSLAGLESRCKTWPDAVQPSDLTAANTTRRHSPPEREETLGQPVGEEPFRREGSLMKSLIQMEETRATDDHALPWPDAHGSCTNHNGRIDGGSALSCGWGPGMKRDGTLVRAHRSLSPEGHRSSSLPPCSQRTVPATTPPAKRDIMMEPLSAKSSPKRCPSENFSTAFGPNAPWQRHSHPRFDTRLDQRGLMSSSPSHSSSAKKRLQFTPSEELEAANHQPSNGGGVVASGIESMERAIGLAWGEQGTEGSEAEPPRPSDTPVSYQGRLQSLADMERVFDDLTREKQQIEAALSRIPGAGGRVSLQAKLDEEALEERLENINREVGSIRMTLKKFHVLRSSANI
ncbi:hypothetical protein AAFF_G00425390 [Aldrovandia affinis]|uniref:M-phase phosphoprotein 9 n=1 Tax=Aldrovandia affinis TaxID=143900 RepID=A0AAD7X146_9TELE|nr:hypothetical protein AAFF_G00425390 [Aldrovandia affinis]